MLTSIEEHNKIKDMVFMNNSKNNSPKTSILFWIVTIFLCYQKEIFVLVEVRAKDRTGAVLCPE